MNDISGKELNVGDLVFTNAGYKRNLQFGIVRRTDYNLHLYRLDTYGLSTARCDMKLVGDHGKVPWYAHNGESCLKVPVTLLAESKLPFYNKIMKILNKDVATADNT